MLAPSQAALIFAAVAADREHLREWLPWVDHTERVEDTRIFLEMQLNSQRQDAAYGFGIWQDERLRGIAGIHDINTADRNAKIGYWLSREAEGRGLMTRAVRALLGVCFNALSLERVEILVATGNHRSAAIPERLGFTLEGVTRHAQWLNGRFVDLRLYSLLRDEFRL